MIYLFSVLLVGLVFLSVYFNLDKTVVISLATGLFGLLSLIIKKTLDNNTKQNENLETISNNITSLSNKFKEWNIDNASQHQKIFDTLKEVIDTTNFLINTKHDIDTYNKNFNSIMSEYLPMLKNKNLRVFATVKFDSIVSVAMSIHKQGFYLSDGSRNDTLTLTSVLDRIKIESNQVYSRGVTLIGQSNMQYFYSTHTTEMAEFIETLTEIFNDDKNAKHQKVQCSFEKLIKDSLRRLVELQYVRKDEFADNTTSNNN